MTPVYLSYFVTCRPAHTFHMFASALCHSSPSQWLQRVLTRESSFFDLLNKLIKQDLFSSPRPRRTRQSKYEDVLWRSPFIRICNRCRKSSGWSRAVSRSTRSKQRPIHPRVGFLVSFFSFFSTGIRAGCSVCWQFHPTADATASTYTGGTRSTHSWDFESKCSSLFSSEPIRPRAGSSSAPAGFRHHGWLRRPLSPCSR